MNNIIHFHDHEFEKYIRGCLGKESDEITVQDMGGIQHLDLGFTVFTDISPITHCNNLESIHFAEDFFKKYDLQILKDLPNVHSISVVNPSVEGLSELYRYVTFTSLEIMYWGDVDICDLNPYKGMKRLSILNFTGKAFSCQNICELTKLQYLRLCSQVTDVEVLRTLPELEEYKNS